MVSFYKKKKTKSTQKNSHGSLKKHCPISKKHISKKKKKKLQIFLVPGVLHFYNTTSVVISKALKSTNTNNTLPEIVALHHVERLAMWIIVRTFETRPPRFCAMSFLAIISGSGLKKKQVSESKLKV